ncbi:hypothetical protein CC1G_15392 [Coprinopsis cinerea okayama7|uniref:Uncharacterized protein n=1 Tax=Coprinopsis cinerea (strain Okayama-7 / 130 / ATCC MYA-4618 / FGSC 9003) TaxID=240176 RepID=D6RQS2_COPC7|nr:hypothetical protein CC1G_15392 [Coprinopsis cinerea okayama7\|eukprot:XP_002910114.1 hypothetical protein CC1G_15392 [Coprinopsis cinerea okayama7\
MVFLPLLQYRSSYKNTPTQPHTPLPGVDPIYNVVESIAATLRHTASVLRELARVTFDDDVDNSTLARRSGEIREYLRSHFPDIKFVACADPKTHAWHKRGGEAAFQVRDRRNVKHTIFVNFSLYGSLNHALTCRAPCGDIHDNPNYKHFLSFLLHVCLLHELGHIVRTVFASRPTPPRYSLLSDTSTGEAGFHVERGVLGGAVVVGYHTESADKSFVLEWENAVCVGFCQPDGEIRWLSWAQREHPLWAIFRRGAIYRVIQHVGSLPTEMNDYPLDTVARLSSINSTSTSGDPCGSVGDKPESTIYPVEPVSPSPGIHPTSSTTSLLCLPSSATLTTGLLGLPGEDREIFVDYRSTPDVI